MKPVYWVLIRDPACSFYHNLLKELATDIQSLEQFDSAAPKNLNRNLFIILLLKITIIYWLMPAVTTK